MSNIDQSFPNFSLNKALCVLLILLFSKVSVAEKVQHFDIWEYQVEGNSLLQTSTIESALSAYLGADKTLGTVEKARDYLQLMYKNQGYPIVVVSIPQQNVIGGIVKLRVIEGKIDRLKISGNKYFSRRELRKELPSLKSGEPLNMQQVRQEIDVANASNPFRSVVPVIRPGRHRGTMEIELKVKDKLPIHGFLEVNNRYTANTTKTRLMGSVSYDHLWQKHHSVSLSYQTSPEDTDEVSVLNMTYAMPTGDASRLVVYAVESNSQVATVTGQGDDLTVLGDGTVYGLRSIHQFPVVNDYYHSLLLGLDYKDFGESQEIENIEGAVGLNVPIKYAAWSLSYNGTIRQPVFTQFSIAGNFGLRGINDPDEFEFKRSLSKANYFYVGGRFGQTFKFSDQLNLAYDVRGQYTESPLISNEQFSSGGVDTVRGYIESSELGDNALLTSLELKYKPFANTMPAKIQSLDFSVFVDAARLKTLETLPNADGDVISTTELAGAGIGVEMKFYENVDLKLYYAEPIKKLERETFEDEGQVHFNLSYEFK